MAQKEREPSPLLQELEEFVETDGRSKTELTRLAGVHRTQYPEWISGRVSPTLDKLEKLGRVLGYRLKWEEIGENER